ncbi:hypothetical protein BBC27_08080 [Acidithiobacillus ferrivorans]|uniref:Uncharacterized protein n=1 Tax=Acidithiobacillus ferrivorans TaxID=160808 RepID=A0A1B9C0F7_9PROT|nr:hypothetical protein [Acidithiobacillus ferrivorans]OCB03414.1 hypothetical protein BBC27_08080 [Acidithiobacillus ferrivorans]
MQKEIVMGKPWNTQKDNALQVAFMARHNITEEQLKKAGDDIRGEREAGHQGHQKKEQDERVR